MDYLTQPRNGKGAEIHHDEPDGPRETKYDIKNKISMKYRFVSFWIRKRQKRNYISKSDNSKPEETMFRLTTVRSSHFANRSGILQRFYQADSSWGSEPSPESQRALSCREYRFAWILKGPASDFLLYNFACLSVKHGNDSSCCVLFRRCRQLRH